MTVPRIVRQVAWAAGILMLATAGIALAEKAPDIQSIGKMEFQKNCASCHGPGGNGDGPVAEFLKHPPTDLTMIRQRNGGIYPQEKVYMWIRNPKDIRGHGTDEMPIWGDRYSEEIIQQYGLMHSGPGTSVRERILELVFYIRTIQQ